MKKIIVTGGNGFIASNLIKVLLKNKSNLILNLDAKKKHSVPESLNQIKKNKNYYFKKIDITNFKKLNRIIKIFQPNMIYHLAAESHVDRSINKPFDFINTNIFGTLNLFESLRLNSNLWERDKNFRIVNVSTDEVYGSLKKNDKKFSENHKFKPNSPYSSSKASADLLARAWYKTFKIPIITTNCSNNYGPWQFPEKLIPVVVSNCLLGKKIPVYGSGKNIRDWLYVDDHVRALLKVSKYGRIGEAYNIGGGKEISNLNIVKKICKIMDKLVPKDFKYQKNISFVNDRLGHDFRYAINYNKIYSKLNFIPLMNFEKGLLTTVKWYVDNKKWLLKKIK